MEFVKGLGADKVIDGRREDIVKAAKQFEPKGLDAVLLTAGGKAAEQAMAALREGARQNTTRRRPNSRLQRCGKAGGPLTRTAWRTFLKHSTA